MGVCRTAVVVSDFFRLAYEHRRGDDVDRIWGISFFDWYEYLTRSIGSCRNGGHPTSVQSMKDLGSLFQVSHSQMPCNWYDRTNRNKATTVYTLTRNKTNLAGFPIQPIVELVSGG